MGEFLDMAHRSQFNVWSRVCLFPTVILLTPPEHLIHNKLRDFHSDLLISKLFPTLES